VSKHRNHWWQFWRKPEPEWSDWCEYDIEIYMGRPNGVIPTIKPTTGKLTLWKTNPDRCYTDQEAMEELDKITDKILNPPST